MLQHAQTQQPNIDGILAVVKYEQASSQWMNEKVKMCLVQYLFDTQDSVYMNSLQKRQRTEDNMKKLPPALLAKLFMFTMLEMKPDHLARCPHNGGHYALGSVPRQLRALLPR